MKRFMTFLLKRLQAVYDRTGIFLFDLMLYVPVKKYSVMSGGVFEVEPVLSTKQGLMCLAKDTNAVPPVRLKLATPLS